MPVITLILSPGVLTGGYLLCSRYNEMNYEADGIRPTPAVVMADGVDHPPVPWWEMVLIQFLNIAGLGSISGAVAGAIRGPVANLRIILSSVFAGAVHNYFSGMLSIKHKGLSITEIGGKYPGTGTRQLICGYTVRLMVIAGAVLTAGPAQILAGLIPEHPTITFWGWIVFLYYLPFTLLPINKIIGRICPLIGFLLVFMAVGLITAPDSLPVFLMLFITVACGSITGFHATQSPLMARCMKNEKLGQRVVYGAVITEAVVAMIWATSSMSFFGGIGELMGVMHALQGNGAGVVNEPASVLPGKFGAFLAIPGVVAVPVTSGDTAFRSTRML